jgi:hypothetical protein
VATKIHPALTFWLSTVESVLSFASNGAQFFLQSASSAPNCLSRSPANPFSPLKEETLPLPQTISDYLRADAQELGDRILESYPPLHSVDNPSSPIIGKLLRKPYPAQTLAIISLVRRWQQARAGAVIAECGTGKTLISLAAVQTHAEGRPFTALAMVPPQLVEKWCREAILTLPRVRVFIIDGQLTDPRHRIAWNLMLWAGNRCGEIRGLRWRSVHWEQNCILVTESVWEGNSTQPKTKKGYRKVALTPTQMAELKKCKDENCPDAGPDDCLLPGRKNRPMDMRWLMSEHIKPFAEAWYQGNPLARTSAPEQFVDAERRSRRGDSNEPAGARQ